MKYMDIYTALAADIANRVFSKGKRLPGEPELCRRFGTARNTVRQALDLLHRQGLIERRKGEGTFITQRGERKTGLVGLLMPNFTSARFFDVLKKELETKARGLGYKIVAETTATGTPREIIDHVRTAARRLAVRRVEGVIFRPHLDPLCTECNLEILHLFRNTETPVVLVDADVATPPERSACDLVAVDNIAAGRRIAAHLLDKRRRRIAFLMSGLSIGSNANWSNRLFGLAGEIAVQGIDDGVQTLRFMPNDADALAALFRSRKRPDAIVCGNDETACCLIKTLAAIGKRIPDDVAVVGFDDDSCARSSVPPLTTIRQPAPLIAKTALKTLLARIRYPNNDPREILLDAPLIARASTAVADISRQLA
jgi:DNA-binding LacI/PurR family transcriptional regulator